MARIDPLKFDSVTSGVVEGLALPYGYGAKGGIFTPRTDYAERRVDERPALTINNGPGSPPTIVGRIVDHKRTDLGMWARCQIDKSSKYWETIKKLIEQGKLFLNPGVLESLMQKSASGELLRAPWVHGRLSRVAGLSDVVDEFDTTRNFKSAGLAVPSWSSRLEHSGLKARTEHVQRPAQVVFNGRAGGLSEAFTYQPVHAWDVRAQVRAECDEALALARRDLNLPGLRIDYFVRPHVKNSRRGWTTSAESDVIHVAADQRPEFAAEAVLHEARHVWQRKHFGTERVHASSASYAVFEHEADFYASLKTDDPEAPMPTFITEDL